MNEHELTDAFERILPEQPSAKGWAGAALRRRQRRRTAMGAAVVAVVAAVAIPLGLSLGAGPQVMTTPAPASTQQTDMEDGRSVLDGCLKAQVENDERSDLVGGQVPEGATKLWLCGGESSPYADGLAFVGPQEALTVGVDAAVEAFNDLTWVEGVAIECALSGEVYQLLFEYPDGTTQMVEGYFAPEGCQHFNTGDGIVEGAGSYLMTLQELWETQRASESVMATEVNGCPGSTSVFTVETADLGRGLGCVVQSSSPIPAPPSPRTATSFKTTC